MRCDRCEKLRGGKRRVSYSSARGDKTKAPPKSRVTLHCSVGDCEGFVTSLGGWKCGLCNMKICKHCHVVLTGEGNHVCLESDKATAEMITKSSKACPGCKRLTTKISGCYQIWCPECHTAWDWNTGEIDSGVVHNALGSSLVAGESRGLVLSEMGEVAVEIKELPIIL